MGSLLVDVRAGLVDAWAELPEFTTPAGPSNQTPLVTFGYKHGAKDRERIWTHRGRFTHEPASLRPAVTFRNEVGAFDVVILVEGIGLSQRETSARAMNLGHVIENHIAAHANWPKVAGLNSLTVEGEGQLLEAFNDNGSLAELTLPVRYAARLTL